MAEIERAKTPEEWGERFHSLSPEAQQASFNEWRRRQWTDLEAKDPEKAARMRGAGDFRHPLDPGPSLEPKANSQDSSIMAEGVTLPPRKGHDQP